MPPWAIPATISKAWACPGTSTFVRRSDDRTTTARADWMAPRRCIVVWPAHLASQRRGALQSRRPKRLMAVCSLAHCGAALSLQAAYGDYQIGAFENFHQPVEDTLIVLRPGPKVFFEYELRFINRLKSQLLISHLFLPITNAPRLKGTRNQAGFEKYPRLFDTIDQIFVTIREPSGRNRGDFLVPHRMAPSSGRAPRRAPCEGPLLGTFRPRGLQPRVRNAHQSARRPL